MRRFPGALKGLFFFFLVTRMVSLSSLKVFNVLDGILMFGCERSVTMML